MHTKKKILSRVSALLLLTVMLLTSSPACFAAHAQTIPPKQASDAAALPCSLSLTFDREEQAGNERSVIIRCERLSIVTVSAKGKNDADRIGLRVYTDSGELTAHTSAGHGEGAILQFLAAYTGCYRITAECANASAEASEISLSATAFSKFKVNEIKELPFSAEHTKKTHRYTHADTVYSAHTDDAEGWEMSVFSIPHNAGDALCYTLDAEGSSRIRAVLYTCDGEGYSAHASHKTEKHDACDAQTVLYSDISYLVIYSSGEFTLDADVIKCTEPEPEALSLPYSGSLSTAETAMCYDEDEYSQLISDFPFCGVRNIPVKYFSVDAGGPSVISLSCERREHAFFSVLPCTKELSAGSVFPLRDYSSYCSETEPTEMCLETFISDSGKAMIAYSGSALDVRIRIEAFPICSVSTKYENEYHKNTPLPVLEAGALCSDSELFSQLGLAAHDSESSEVSGYVIECGDRTRCYYSKDDPILPPEKKGECTLYAVMRRVVVRDGIGEGRTHLVPVCTFRTTGVLFIPTIEEIIEEIEKSEGGSAVYLLIALLLAAGAGTVLFFVLRRALRKRKLTEHRRIAPRRTRARAPVRYIGRDGGADENDDDDDSGVEDD